MTSFDEKLRPALEALLETGETLTGVCAASQQQSMFKGRAVALGVTDRRLILQPLDRRGDATGEEQALRPEEIAKASADGVSGGWPNLGAALADRVAVKLDIRTTSGEKLKLMMMRGGGSLTGGEDQSTGVAALAAWFERADARC